MENPAEVRQSFEHRIDAWSLAKRILVSGLAGLTLARAVRKRAFSDGALGVVGLIAIARSLLNRDLISLFGRASHPVTTLLGTIRVQASVQEVYAFWSNPENYPLFMTHVLGVERIEHGLLRWTISAKGRPSLSWRAAVGPDFENQIFGWRSLPSEPVTHACTVTMMETLNGGTTVSIVFSYGPPMGLIGALVEQVFGPDVIGRFDSDLQSMKRLIEARTKAKRSA